MNEGVGWEKQNLYQSKKHQNNFTGTAYALLNLNRKCNKLTFWIPTLGRRRLSTISSRVRFSLSCQHDECDEHDGWRHFHSKWNPASTKKVCHMSQRSSWLQARHMTPMTLCNITGKQSASTSKAKRHTYSIQRKRTTNTDTAYRSYKYMIFFLNWTHNVCRTTFTRKPWSISNL